MGLVNAEKIIEHLSRRIAQLEVQLAIRTVQYEETFKPPVELEGKAGEDEWQELPSQTEK